MYTLCAAWISFVSNLNKQFRICTVVQIHHQNFYDSNAQWGVQNHKDTC
jgi:hypothetical protein